MKSQNLSIISLILNVLLIAAVVFLFVKTSGSQKEVEKSADEISIPSISGDSTGLKIAYVNLDTLLLEYKFSIELNEELLTEHARSKANLEMQLKQFEKDYNAFMEKARLGSFISQASMETQQQELIDKQAYLQQLDSDLTEKLVQRQEEMNQQLYDSVMNFMAEYNKGQFNLVLGNAGGTNVLYASEGMNITKEIIDLLNIRYEKAKKGEL
ncbi:MAG TPA: OmpH family outer membrane protein [Bacteroidales bacterium]|jgi:outer membrane protein|nr:OmpH family outer membrane protein [Bacteroidales bacterium]MDD4236159.1 OmpH family outer membrane protein [Bacteroidales bacterium]HXK81257.1 OmpH family outer membrane protein [Bacteroidales bacterium]